MRKIAFQFTRTKPLVQQGTHRFVSLETVLTPAENRRRPMYTQLPASSVVAAVLFVASACQSPPAAQESAKPEENETAPLTTEESPSRSADLSLAPAEERNQSNESETIQARNEAILARLEAEERAREEQENRERLEEELEAMRAELEELRQSGSEPSGELDVDTPQESQSYLEATAEAEREWRPVFAEFQKRYSDKKQELDTGLEELKRYQAWCGYTQIGEPNLRQKEMGVRQEGIQIDAQSELKKVGYSLSCDTIDLDIKRFEQERFDTLREIQKECYDEAIYRGASTAKARLR